MKIAILTFPCAVNRGAHMQCYALQAVLRGMGHEVEVVSVELPSGKLSLKGWLDKTILEWKNKRFRDKHYSRLTRTYCSAAELRDDPPLADAYIVGSDQVWNPAITGSFGAEAFFLDFAPAGVRRVAYAASFGTSVWVSAGAGKDTEIARLLKAFDAVSVRETDGVEICRRTFGVDSAVSVIDPVFLLEDYSTIVGRTGCVRREVVCYPLCHNEATVEVFMQVSRDLKLRKVSFSPKMRGAGVRVKMFASVASWLRTLARSSFVVTNSFHCMAFCIIFRKRFVVTPPHKGRESRMVSMLRLLGIEERYVKSAADFHKRKQALYADIDYTSVSARLSALRIDSLNFLHNNL